MNKHSIINVFLVVIVITLGLALGGCGAGVSAVNGPVITSLVAEHSALYPLGNTRITCNAQDRNSATLNYQWVSNEGTITGNGQTITWEAPKNYGDFHVMCTVIDASGYRTSQTVTVSVIVRDTSTPNCCK